MEWVETTAKTVDDAKTEALDQLGVGADEAEFDVLEEPRPGLFGRVRGTARVRARVRPAPVRPKNDRRRSSKRGKKASSTSSGRGPRDSQRTEPQESRRSRSEAGSAATAEGDASGRAAGGRSSSETSESSDSAPDSTASGSTGPDRTGPDSTASSSSRRRSSNRKKAAMTQDQDTQTEESTVTPEEVGDAAVAFVEGLVTAFGGTGTTAVSVDGIELDVSVTGSDLGLLVGPRGRTLLAVQDLTRVAAQRRLGDQDTRLRVDVGGYRERRSAALASFAASVAEQVRETGVARALEPMASADRKVVHDALNEAEGVTSRSEGEDPRRYIVVAPA